MKDDSTVNQHEIVKTETGPEFTAPENPTYASSFDEFAGVFVREDEADLMGDRDDANYPHNREAHEFGYQMAERFRDREWPEAESDVYAEWSKHHHGDWSVVKGQVQEGWIASRDVR